MDASRNLSYRGALTSNLIAINGFESAATAQSSARIDLLDNEYMLSNTIRKCESQLMGNAVPGRDGGLYTSAMHPYVVYDFMSDNSAGSAVDTLKRSEAGASGPEDGHDSRLHRSGMGGRSHHPHPDRADVHQLSFCR